MVPRCPRRKRAPLTTKVQVAALGRQSTRAPLFWMDAREDLVASLDEGHEVRVEVVRMVADKGRGHSADGEPERLDVVGPRPGLLPAVVLMEPVSRFLEVLERGHKGASARP